MDDDLLGSLWYLNLVFAVRARTGFSSKLLADLKPFETFWAGDLDWHESKTEGKRT
ncbi:hypothetical protein OAA27_00960 [bacterium]|nr:hypothetical protein [bacterium]